MSIHTNRTNTGTAPTMRNAERLVHVEMTHVGPAGARRREAALRVQIGAVHVHLSSTFMGNARQISDSFFKNSVSGRVRDHDRRQIVLVLLGLGLEVVEVDVAVVVTLDDDALEARHDGRGRVRAVRGDGNQAHVSMPFADGLLVGADREQPRVLAGSTTIRLDRYGVEARNFT